MKTSSESRIELRNLQILKKIPENSSHFLSSEQPCEPKSLDVALKIAGDEKIRLVAVNLEAIRFNERSVSDGGNLCPMWLVIPARISLK